MKLLLLISALFVATAVVAAEPVETVDEAANLVDNFLEKPQAAKDEKTVDVTALINDMQRLHESASDVIQQVEVTLSTLESLMPHSIKKRQTTVNGSVRRGPGGTTGRIDVNHRRGGTTYNGNISRGPGGTNYGVGVNHRRGNTNWGASVNRGRGGTSYGGSYERTWNNGRTSFGANFGRGGGGGTSGGFRFTHRF